MSGAEKRDHGGGIDAAMARYGGQRSDWLDLSTGINPDPYPLPPLQPDAWTALPDTAALERLIAAARAFWNVPDEAQVIAAPGASALIAQMPSLSQGSRVYIPAPTYNEHAAAFRAHAFWVDTADASLRTQVHVHPNNPDGRLYAPEGDPGEDRLTIIDESFCDVAQEASHIAKTAQPGTIILKSFGKFWGLAGLRLGFAIGHPGTLAAKGRPSLSDLIGPWAVSGPALAIGATALEDTAWASQTREKLTQDAARLDALMTATGAQIVGGTTLFRLYKVADAAATQDALARHHILTRTFPYSRNWIRLGLPPADRWPQLERALGTSLGTAGGAIRASGSAVPSP